MVIIMTKPYLIIKPFHHKVTLGNLFAGKPFVSNIKKKFMIKNMGVIPVNMKKRVEGSAESTIIGVNVKTTVAAIQLLIVAQGTIEAGTISGT